MLRKYSELAEMFARLADEEGDQNVVIDWWKEETIVEVLSEIDMDDFDQDTKENLEFLRETPFEALEKWRNGCVLAVCCRPTANSKNLSSIWLRV